MGDLEDERGMAVVFGGFARATFGKFVFQPEILFSENQSLAAVSYTHLTLPTSDLV